LRATTGARREELVRIAQRLIADQGLEGFRTRHVAAQAGIDTGTLHYHFPSKEALIQAVLESLVSDFRVNRASSTEKPATALDELRREILDAALRVQTTPQQIRVLLELRVRSYRDAAIAAMLKQVDRWWNSSVAAIVTRGQEQGVVRRDLQAETVASVIRTEIEGMGVRGLADPAHVGEIAEALYRQLDTWLRVASKGVRGGQSHDRQR
jgi:AcrR family transcriptional regulator